jgi:hypothetical protein
MRGLSGGPRWIPRGNLERPPHDELYGTVHHSRQVMQRVFDVLPRPQLADPASVWKLPGGVLRHAGEGEQGDFLVTVFKFVASANDTTESDKGVAESLQSNGACHARGPGVLRDCIWPPPVAGVPGRKRNAIIITVSEALDLMPWPTSPGKIWSKVGSTIRSLAPCPSAATLRLPWQRFPGRSAALDRRR